MQLAILQSFRSASLVPPWRGLPRICGGSELFYYIKSVTTKLAELSSA